eukprot:GDKJ01002799.1.p1 GENE.GDKJ01002799.1~~GDKJ01002799.1.p1  ORF type:complete len:143 (+),score=31.98 GDKJ01002799.1:565-993(+)
MLECHFNPFFWFFSKEKDEDCENASLFFSFTYHVFLDGNFLFFSVFGLCFDHSLLVKSEDCSQTFFSRLKEESSSFFFFPFFHLSYSTVQHRIFVLDAYLEEKARNRKKTFFWTSLKKVSLLFEGFNNLFSFCLLEQQLSNE